MQPSSRRDVDQQKHVQGLDCGHAGDTRYPEQRCSILANASTRPIEEEEKGEKNPPNDFPPLSLCGNDSQSLCLTTPSESY